MDKSGIDEAGLPTWQAWLSDDSLWATLPMLVHGNLHPGHILIDRDQRVSGGPK
jgi:macrolide phosphotransferase